MSLQPPRDKRVSLAKGASLVSDDATVALGGGLSARLPMALVRELVRQGRRGLHLIGSAHSIDVDLLVAVGAVRRCEGSYVGFEQDLGVAPAYRRAAEQGTIEIAESCCATILAQLRASAPKGGAADWTERRGKEAVMSPPEVQSKQSTLDEWFVVALARTIHPAETVFHGFGSPCAQVAMHVARRTHAPDMTLVEGAAVRSVDPLGVRTSEFAAAELARAFTPQHGPGCAC